MRWEILETDGEVRRVAVVSTQEGVWLSSRGRAFLVAPASSGLHSETTDDSVIAPMTGRVVTISVAEGSSVDKGEVLVVLEAMKMEHRLVAHRAGVVEAVRCVSGDLIEQGETLVTLAES